MTELSREVADGPRAHALVIGVGHYRYSKNGRDPNDELKIRPAQLTSPPHSALAFANWLLAPPDHGYAPPPGDLPPAPLASVELLVSTRNDELTSYRRPDTGEIVNLDKATLSNVQEAFDRWRDRLWDKPNDVGFFFFSGHGYRAGETLALLLEDFGKDAKQPFAHAFDFDETRRGLAMCAAKRQFFFVDACQTAKSKSVRRNPARSLISDDDGRVPSTDSIVFYAAADSTKAFGAPDAVSNFTEAVLEGLGGLGCFEDEDQRWVARTDLLYTAIEQTLHHLRETRDAPKQIPASTNGSTPIHTIGATVPMVPCTVWCEPKEADVHARLSVHLDGTEVDAREPSRERWEFKLCKRNYQLQANFPGAPYERYDGNFDVALPRYKRRIPARRIE